MVDRLVPWDVQVYCTEKWPTYASVIPQANLVQRLGRDRALMLSHVSPSPPFRTGLAAFIASGSTLSDQSWS